MCWRRLIRWVLVVVAVIVGVPLAILVWIALVIELARLGLMPY